VDDIKRRSHFKFHNVLTMYRLLLLVSMMVTLMMTSCYSAKTGDDVAGDSQADEYYKSPSGKEVQSVPEGSFVGEHSLKKL